MRACGYTDRRFIESNRDRKENHGKSWREKGKEGESGRGRARMELFHVRSDHVMGLTLLLSWGLGRSTLDGMDSGALG